MATKEWDELDQFKLNKIENSKGCFKMIHEVLKFALKNKDCCLKHRLLAHKFAASVILDSWCDVAGLDLIRVQRKLEEEKDLKYIVTDCSKINKNKKNDFKRVEVYEK